MRRARQRERERARARESKRAPDQHLLLHINQHRFLPTLDHCSSCSTKTGPDMRHSVLGLLSTQGFVETQQRFAARVRAGVLVLKGKIPSTVTVKSKTSKNSKDSLPVIVPFSLPGQVPAPQISILRRVVSIFYSRYLARNFETHRTMWRDPVRIRPHFYYIHIAIIRLFRSSFPLPACLPPCLPPSLPTSSPCLPVSLSPSFPLPFSTDSCHTNFLSL